jgi:hypothetical protein
MLPVLTVVFGKSGLTTTGRSYGPVSICQLTTPIRSQRLSTDTATISRSGSVFADFDNRLGVPKGKVANLFNHFPQSDIDIVAPDGTVRYRTKGIVDPKSIAIPDPSLLIQPGDEIRRRIPSGVEETFEVIDPIYYQAFHTIPAHYQVKVRKKGMFPSGQGGNYSVNITGQNARVNIGSRDQSTNIATQGDVFGDIRAALQGAVKNADELQNLLAAVDGMKRQRGADGFGAAYRSFVSLAADHLGVLAPFLPALAQLLP